MWGVLGKAVYETEGLCKTLFSTKAHSHFVGLGKLVVDRSTCDRGHFKIKSHCPETMVVVFC